MSDISAGASPRSAETETPRHTPMLTDLRGRASRRPPASAAEDADDAGGDADEAAMAEEAEETRNRIGALLRHPHGVLRRCALPRATDERMKALFDAAVREAVCRIVIVAVGHGQVESLHLPRVGRVAVGLRSGERWRMMRRPPYRILVLDASLSAGEVRSVVVRVVVSKLDRLAERMGHGDILQPVVAVFSMAGMPVGEDALPRRAAQAITRGATAPAARPGGT